LFARLEPMTSYHKASLPLCQGTLHIVQNSKKSQLAPACATSEEGSDHFGSYVRNFFLHFYKMLFTVLKLMTSWSQGNTFTGLPFIVQNSDEIG
jgi:hypothetical protein